MTMKWQHIHPKWTNVFCRCKMWLVEPSTNAYVSVWLHALIPIVIGSAVQIVAQQSFSFLNLRDSCWRNRILVRKSSHTAEKQNSALIAAVRRSVMPELTDWRCETRRGMQWAMERLENWPGRLLRGNMTDYPDNKKNKKTTFRHASSLNVELLSRNFKKVSKRKKQSHF